MFAKFVSANVLKPNFFKILDIDNIFNQCLLVISEYILVHICELGKMIWHRVLVKTKEMDKSGGLA